jgi:TPR repeat protein
MVNLGMLEKKDGRLDQARRWYRKAIATGHPEWSTEARTALNELEEAEETARRAHWAARYASQASRRIQDRMPGEDR